jgi:hypothetical protein
MGTEYNGWANRETWNVALWVLNDYSLYSLASEWVGERTRRQAPVSWDRFVKGVGLVGCKTPDRFSYSGRKLDRRALTALLKELV